MSSHGVKANEQYMSMRNSKTSPFNYIMKEKDMREHVKEFNQTLDKREHPRRDVTHFESPPRRRGREQEDKVLEDYHNAKMIERETEDQVDPAETVDRLLMTGKEYEKRRAYLRKKVYRVCRLSLTFIASLR